MKKLIFLLVIGLTVLVAMPFQAGASPLAYTTARIAGQDRIETALSIAQKGWTTAQTVILCEGADYPDSIAAAPFAASLDAPILLTGGQSLDPRVVSELQRLKPQKVFLLGGSGRLTSAVEAGLNSLSLSWERIGGETRYETSVLLAGRLNSESVIIANGDNFPDALSAASYAGMQQIPIVLVSKTLPACVDGYVKNKQPKHVVVIGGEGAVPTDMLTKSGITVETRLGGQDRFATNAKVVTYMQNAVQADDLFLASGLTFPDAVAGTVLASKYKAPLLLTEKDDIPSAVYTVMREHMKVEPPTATTSYGQGKITAAGGLNLRETPSTSGTVLVTVPEGATVEIAAQQGQWYKATYQNKSGWLSASYVTITATYKQGKITAAGGLNMRESSATTARILTTIPQNALVTVTNEQNGWYKVTYQGTTGWIYADYVTVQSTGDGSGQAEGIDLSPNGKVYIFGGLGVISATAQNIIEGKAASQYPENLQDFPPLPASLNPPDPASPSGYDPAKEVALDPFQGIPDNALQGKTIIIDPGHGGPDSGAVGPSKTMEKNNTLAIALYLNDILRQAGATVTLTRKTDASVAPSYTEVADLQARVDLANTTKPDLFISIHNNAMTNSEVNGTATYYSEESPQVDESAKLAAALQNALIGALGTNNQGVRKADYYVLCNTTMPSALVEVAYISNPYEEARLQNPVFQKNAAAAIFRGIYRYYVQP